MILVEAALSFTVILSLIGFGIEAGQWLILRQQTSFIASSAASAGARKLQQKPDCGCVVAAINAARAVANGNISNSADGLTSYTVVSVQTYSSISPPTPSSDDTTAAFMGVQISGQAQPLFIGPVMSSNSQAFD